MDVYQLKPLTIPPPPEPSLNTSPSRVTTPLALRRTLRTQPPTSDLDPPDFSDQQGAHDMNHHTDDSALDAISVPSDNPLKRPCDDSSVADESKRPATASAKKRVGAGKKGGAKKSTKAANDDEFTPTGKGYTLVSRPRRATPLNPNQLATVPGAFFQQPIRNSSLDIFNPPPSDSLTSATTSPGSVPPSSSVSAASTSTGAPPQGDSLTGDVIRIRLPSNGLHKSVVATPKASPATTAKPTGTAKGRAGRTATTKKVGVAGHGRRSAAGGGLGLVDKGKGREVDSDSGSQDILNNDYCDCCNGVGRFLCCDGCPRSFHFSCLEPPLTIDEVPEDQWYCTDCKIRKLKVEIPRQPRNIFGPLLRRVQTVNPIQYQLPVEIRTNFRGVATSETGAFINTELTRPLKIDRKGFAEDRDPFTLKDAKGGAALCYQCGGSAAPLAGTNAVKTVVVSGSLGVEASRGRPIISCDYCALSWHYDCLDPPLANLPMPTQKWMCPNHIDHVFTKPRMPKSGLPTKTITKPFQRNNGNIEVISSAPESVHEPVEYEEVVINAKKYRVPESTIRLDFWSKVLGLAPATFKNDAPADIDNPSPVAAPPAVASAYHPPAHGTHLDRSASMSPLTSLGSSPASDTVIDDTPIPVLRLPPRVALTIASSLNPTNEAGLSYPRASSPFYATPNASAISSMQSGSPTSSMPQVTGVSNDASLPKKITLRLPSANQHNLNNPSNDAASYEALSIASTPGSVSTIPVKADEEDSDHKQAHLADYAPPNVVLASIAPTTANGIDSSNGSRGGPVLNPKELDRLLAIKELIKIKGEDALLAFLLT